MLFEDGNKSSTLKMEAPGSSRVLMPIYETTLRHIAEGRNPTLETLSFLRVVG
jgi:hypothetical protein